MYAFQTDVFEKNSSSTVQLKLLKLICEYLKFLYLFMNISKTRIKICQKEILNQFFSETFIKVSKFILIFSNIFLKKNLSIILQLLNGGNVRRVL